MFGVTNWFDVITTRIVVVPAVVATGGFGRLTCLCLFTDFLTGV
jgi:hypothetical protein